MSNNKLHKSKIIYDRLYKEYGQWDTIADFMGEFGLKRQSFYDRRNAKYVDYDEIKEVFPEINNDWLHSNKKSELNKLPVRKKDTSSDYNFTHKSKKLAHLINDEGVNYDAQDELLSYLQSRSESLSQELFEISQMMKSLLVSMKKRGSDD